jgi:membrane protease YdiL (CAAX protease family)
MDDNKIRDDVIADGDEGNAIVELDNGLKKYKAVCFKLGVFMCIYFVCRIVAGVVGFFVSQIGGLSDSQPLMYAVITIIQIVFIYGIPTLTAMMLFKSFDYYYSDKSRLKKLYEKPRRFANKLGTFPAMYGLGQGVNLLTILVFYIIRRVFRNLEAGIELERFFEPMVFEPPQDLLSAFIMVFLFVVVAAVVEEFLVRGIIYDALKPYGHGVAIIISSILFGLMHGSIHMLFYTTVLGFALGYIRYATNSLLVVTILHALINAVAAGLLFLFALDNMTGGTNALILSLSNVYIIAMLALVVLGIVAIIKRIPTIKKYKIENNWTQISAKRKMAIFFLSIPVMIMLVLAIEEHAGNPLLGLVMNRIIN